ncbi:MAG: hypothetical protein K2Q24_00380 [Chitinophagaceae bacterium]|jgi:hypothetical protein|nr:hypothetical protein [Chitinophagaceae bacterium]
MQRKKADVDVVKDVLQLMKAARPDSVFINSLAFQYEERGGLSKKQLEGLYQKAMKAQAVPEGKLATLEAIILKKPTRERAAASAPTPMFTKDEAVGAIIDSILNKYPQHKRILFFKAKYENNETLTAPEITELKRFEKMLK